MGMSSASRSTASGTYGVAKERGAPTGEDATQAFGAPDLAPGLEVALVKLRVDLSATLDEIKRGDGSVRGALEEGEQKQWPLAFVILTQARIPPSVQAA